MTIEKVLLGVRRGGILIQCDGWMDHVWRFDGGGGLDGGRTT